MNFSDIFKTVPGWIPESEFTDIFKRVTKDATVSGVHVATALGNESTTNSKKPKKPKDVRAGARCRNGRRGCREGNTRQY